MTRLEIERVTMVKEFEREQAVGRKKAEDENKNALLRQAEEKRRLKEMEEKKELDREKKENEQLKREQELIRLRDQKEVENERGSGGGGGGGGGDEKNNNNSKINLNKSELFGPDSPDEKQKNPKNKSRINSPNENIKNKNKHKNKNKNLYNDEDDFDHFKSPEQISENLFPSSQNKKNYNDDVHNNYEENEDSMTSLKELRNIKKNKSMNTSYQSADFEINNSKSSPSSDRAFNRNSDIIRELEAAKIGMIILFYKILFWFFT